MRTLSSLVLIFVLLGSVLVGCGPTVEPATVPEPTSTGAQPTRAPTAPLEPTPAPVPHGRLVIGWIVNPDMAPEKMVASYSQGNPVFDGLVLPVGNGELIPMLATSWKLLDDQVTWEFKLREGVTFQNGEPFNAEVVKWNVDLIQTEQLRWYGRISTIKEVQVIDDYTVHIITAAPDALLPGRMMFFLMPPRGVEEAGGLEEFGKMPVGTGSYKIVEFAPNERILMEYWPDSWRNGVFGIADKPLEIEWVHMPDVTARMAALRAGDIDFMQDVPYDAVATLEQEGFVTTSVVEAAPQVVVLDMFAEGSPFQDVRVRQAVNYAVDKDAICNELHRGYSQELPGQPVGADGFGHNPEITAYPYDPEKAKQLLAEAGYPNGFDTTLELRGTAGEPRGETVAAYLADVGINAEIVIVEYALWIDKIYSGDRTEMFWTGVNYLPIFDGDFSYVWFWSANEPEGARFFKHDRYDELFVAQRQEMDPEKRLVMLQEMASILHKEAPVLYLFLQARVGAMNPRVKGLELMSNQMFYLDYVSLDE